MKRLNLPPCPLRTRPSAASPGREEVFDPLRQQWVTLTAEERVRQLFTAWLIAAKGYRPTRMANEMTITLNGMSRRCDTVVFDPDGRRPAAIIEYKAPTVKITAEVFGQAARYNLVLRTPLLMVSNGLRHYCAVTAADAAIRFLTDIPTYDELAGMLAKTETGGSPDAESHRTDESSAQ